MSLFAKIGLPLTRRTQQCLLGTNKFLVRNISTSQKVLSSGPSFKYILKHNNLSEADKAKIQQEAKDMYKDWIPYGWNIYDKIEDTTRYKTTTFMLVVCFTFGLVFIFWYRPRGIEAEWAKREAFLELERRRQLGLPLVDPDLIPKERVKLPSKEELGKDFKYII